MAILTNLSLFSGAGGLDLGARIVGGFRTVCYIENDPYAQGVLMSRMRDGSLDDAPIWDDVRAFDGKTWRGLVDVVSGGFPCQDLSVAGKRLGIREGQRSSLWFEFARIIREVGPRFVIVENVPGLIFSGGIGDVLGSLAEVGYDAEWRTWSAADVGAKHIRERVWIVAHSKSLRGRSQVADSTGKRLERAKQQQQQQQQCVWPGDSSWWDVEPDVGRVANGVAFRVDRLRLTGNGVVPQQSVATWQIIKELAQ